MQIDVLEILTRLSLLAKDPMEILGFEANTFDHEEPKAHRVAIDSVHLEELKHALSGLSWLASFEGGVARNAFLDSTGITIESIAHWLLAQARLTTPENALRSLHKILQVNSDILHDIVPIWGFSPRAAMTLKSGDVIVPIEELPPSRLKDFFLRVVRHKFSQEFAHMLSSPGSALIRTKEVGPIYQERTSDAAMKLRQQGETMLRLLTATACERNELMIEMGEEMMSGLLADSNISVLEESEEILTVMALACPHPIFPLGQWYQRPHYLPIISGVKSFGWPKNEHPFCFALNKQDYDFDRLNELLHRYFSLSPDARRRLRTPLTRLNVARLNLSHRTVDAAAMELGISVEALLTQDRDSYTPISHLLKVRGALLMGGDGDVKRANYKLLRDVYEMRSRVAHEGTLAPPLTKSSTLVERARHKKIRDGLTQGIELCRGMVVKIIECGGFPNWDDLMLGIDALDSKV